jgi:hypothetical protein
MDGVPTRLVVLYKLAKQLAPAILVYLTYLVIQKHVLYLVMALLAIMDFLQTISLYFLKQRAK